MASSNTLNLYVKCSRLVFSVEPSEDWTDFDAFEDDFRSLYGELICKNCKLLLIDPCVPSIPSKQFSCHHRVCLDCIGKKQTTPTNCKLCKDFTLFEKSQQTKLLLNCYQDLCMLVKNSWIYAFIQRKMDHDTGQYQIPSLIDIIDLGVNYGRPPSSVAVSLNEITSNDENSLSSGVIIKEEVQQQPSLIQQTILPAISQISPVIPNSAMQPVSETVSERVIVPPTPNPIQTIAPINQPLSVVSPPSIVAVGPQIVHYQAPQLPSTSKLTIPTSQQHVTVKQSAFIRYPGPIMKQLVNSASITTRPIVAPMKISQFSTPSSVQQPQPTIYSVMYTGSGNKITLKRKPPDEVQEAKSTNNINLLKTDNNLSSNFKKPPMQQFQTSQLVTQPTTVSSINVQSQSVASNPGEPPKRRGCRCGNATAAPGKLTCCGQRCPCYVDSKACIDCKCKGCRNPHYADGHKKMRHHVPDPQTQHQQQQNFLASIQQAQKPATSSSLLSQDDKFGIIDPSSLMNKSPNSISNCIISMNSNGQYQIKPQNRIIMKEPGKTMNPLIFPTTTSIHQSTSAITTMGSIQSFNKSTSSNIQIVGVYSHLPMMNGDKNQKVIVKTEPGTVTTFADGGAFNVNNLNSNLL